MMTDIVYLIAPGSSGPAAASLTREGAVRWAAEHYTYPSQIIGVPLVGDLPAAPRAGGRDPVGHWESGASFSVALDGVRFERTRNLYRAIWRMLADDMLTDAEIITLIRATLNGTWSDSAIRSRRAELTRAGWLVRFGCRDHAATYWAREEG